MTFMENVAILFLTLCLLTTNIDLVKAVNRDKSNQAAIVAIGEVEPTKVRRVRVAGVKHRQLKAAKTAKKQTKKQAKKQAKKARTPRPTESPTIFVEGEPPTFSPTEFVSTESPTDFPTSSPTIETPSPTFPPTIPLDERAISLD
eukprot:CAMPEP_0197173456 /NCGR_PEP_ID=MMETSP1423-20130617/384_1 /TAXON_ID=476441 /ORGANISM="Pseudo-nitzschia heimii, Strain UNC1101" /LENGTH=144 /DNA_ID=CAMNT_0042622277 /DNA_START=120 /DNA_END=554 /DNA_ORIENTATION=-